MTANTSTPAALRCLIEAVIERHHEAGQLYGHAICGNCRQSWPCDAHRLAEALLAAVEGLEFFEDDNRTMYGDKARAALAAAAATLTGDDDDR